MGRSEEFFARAKRVLPGGVNSPVRAFGSVGGVPRFVRRGLGSRIVDEDGKEYLDLVCSWGPLLLGHAAQPALDAARAAMENGLTFGAPTAAEVEIAEFITQNVPHVEMIRMVNSGTEAVMSALRVARGFTGRDKVIKFSGCYHGHCDSMLVKAGSGALTFGRPNSAGVTAGAAADTLLAAYNDPQSVERLFRENPGQVACVIVEPVAANMGVVPPQDGFLQALRRLCDENGALLIFDEVITGFRLCFGGAAQAFGVTPDLVTYGKIIGGGMPVGAYGGRREIMEMVSPLGPVYQAGTLSGNPVAMAAGLATLRALHERPELYSRVNRLGALLRGELENRLGPSCAVTGVGSLCCVFFTPGPVRCYEDAQRADTAQYARFFHYALDHGLYLAPAQFEAMFLSAAHTEEDVRFAAGVIADAAAYAKEGDA